MLRRCQINAPVVIGRLYNDEDRPPVNKNGEIIYMPDYPENKELRRIYIEFKSGVSVLISDEKISLKAGDTRIVVNKSGDVLIDAKGKVTVTAKGDLELKGSNVKIESQGSMELNAGATAKFEAKGNLDIKGAIVNIN